MINLKSLLFGAMIGLSTTAAVAENSTYIPDTGEVIIPFMVVNGNLNYKNVRLELNNGVFDLISYETISVPWDFSVNENEILTCHNYKQILISNETGRAVSINGVFGESVLPDKIEEYAYTKIKRIVHSYGFKFNLTTEEQPNPTCGIRGRYYAVDRDGNILYASLITQNMPKSHNKITTQ